MDHTFKIAGYLDEAGEDPAVGCDTLARHGINYAVLRHVWGGKNISQCNDDGCKKLKKILIDSNVSVVSICSDLGDVPITQLSLISEDFIKRTFDIASYFGAESIRFLYGRSVKGQSSSAVDDWLSKISDFAIRNNIIPVLEITDDACIIEPADIANLLSKHQKYKIQYDPVQIILKRKIDPFIRYWSLLKNKIYSIDVRDYTVGRGFKPPGFGDSKIRETLEDAKSSKFNGWLFIEPNLGRRYGSATTKSETFGLAIEGIKYIF